jgi:predicted XRE-type DNA-binding protein
MKERFFSQVDKTDPSGCWICTGNIFKSGYGLFKFEYNTLYAHRVSWELENGPIPEGLLVLHDCPGGDNPLCVNHNHLWLGTNQDNTNDMIIKGRQGANVKLNENDIEVIRHLFDTNQMKQKELSEIFGISINHVSLITRRKVWTHVG